MGNMVKLTRYIVVFLVSMFLYLALFAQKL